MTKAVHYNSEHIRLTWELCKKYTFKNLTPDPVIRSIVGYVSSRFHRR